MIKLIQGDCLEELKISNKIILMSKIDIHRLKDKIIIEVLDYYKTKDDKYKTEALKDLLIFVKYYAIIIKKEHKINKRALREFILNDKGYNNTVKDLYNYLKNDIS